MPNYQEFPVSGTYCDPQERDNAERMGYEAEAEDISIDTMIDVDAVESFYDADLQHRGQVTAGCIMLMRSGLQHSVLLPYATVKDMLC